MLEKNTLTEQISNAYFSTDYRVFTQSGILHLHAQGDSVELKQLLAKHGVQSAAFITAYNPKSQPTSRDENELRQVQLVQEVAPYWQYLEGEGADKNGEWPPEPSLLILGISLVEARKLARKYCQYAFLFSNENGRTKPIAACPEDQAMLIHPLQRMVNELNIILGATKVTNEELQEESNKQRMHVTFVPRSPSLPEFTCDYDRPLSPAGEALLDYLNESGYVCPVSEAWYALWRKLPSKAREINRPSPPPHPKIWDQFHDMKKRELFIKYILWADQTEGMTDFAIRVRNLAPEQWIQS